MENLHLTPDDGEDDLYSGYDYRSIANVRTCLGWLVLASETTTTTLSLETKVLNEFFFSQELEEDPEFQRVIQTGYAQRPHMQTMV